MLGAGLGFGGSCLPKDLAALISLGRAQDYPLEVLEAVARVNRRQRLLLARRLEEIYPSLAGVRVALWGLAYKPGTDDLRYAPDLDLLRYLERAGAWVRAYDPQERARQQAAGLCPGTRVVADPYQAVAEAEALLVVTEWPEFQASDWRRVHRLMRRGAPGPGRRRAPGPGPAPPPVRWPS